VVVLDADMQAEPAPPCRSGEPLINLECLQDSPSFSCLTGGLSGCLCSTSPVSICRSLVQQSVAAPVPITSGVWPSQYSRQPSRVSGPRRHPLEEGTEQSSLRPFFSNLACHSCRRRHYCQQSSQDLCLAEQFPCTIYNSRTS
jgi:hypothetical protein